MKIEVKNIDYEWNAFFPGITLVSAGVADIIDQVEDMWENFSPLEGKKLKWEVKGNKFVVREIEPPAGKLSKSHLGV